MSVLSVCAVGCGGAGNAKLAGVFNAGSNTVVAFFFAAGESARIVSARFHCNISGGGLAAVASRLEVGALFILALVFSGYGTSCNVVMRCSKAAHPP
jgi:hypothetical protein